mgnify:CR=1 FL=1
MLKMLLTSLAAEQFLGQWFSYSQVQETVPLIDLKFLDVLARNFDFQTEPALQPPSISSKEVDINRRYKVTLESILKFFMTELFISKKEYSQYDLDDAIKHLELLYLPVGN